MVRTIACLSVPVKMISTIHAGSKCLLFTLFGSAPFFGTKIKANKTVSFLLVLLLLFFVTRMNYYIHFDRKVEKFTLKEKMMCLAREFA